MKISIQYEYRDFFRFNIGMISRYKSSYIDVLVCSVLVFFAIGSYRGFPIGLHDYLFQASVAVLASTCTLLVWTLLSVSIKSLRLSRVLGRQGSSDLEIDELGLHFTTPNSDGTLRWTGVQDVVVFAGLLVFKIPSKVNFIIPRRCFASLQDFEEFAQYSRDMWQQARG